MKTKIYLHILPAILLAAFITSGSFFINHVEKKKEKGEIENEKSSPELAYDNFLLSRTYPNAAFDVKGFAQLRFNKQQLSVYVMGEIHFGVAKMRKDFCCNGFIIHCF